MYWDTDTTALPRSNRCVEPLTQLPDPPSLQAQSGAHFSTQYVCTHVDEGFWCPQVQWVFCNYYREPRGGFLRITKVNFKSLPLRGIPGRDRTLISFVSKRTSVWKWLAVLSFWRQRLWLPRRLTLLWENYWHEFLRLTNIKYPFFFFCRENTEVIKNLNAGQLVNLLYDLCSTVNILWL